jgi:hypothetical protein
MENHVNEKKDISAFIHFGQSIGEQREGDTSCMVSQTSHNDRLDHGLPAYSAAIDPPHIGIIL